MGEKHCAFGGRVVVLGFGCIGQGVLPLLLRHIAMRPGQVTVISPGRTGMEGAQALGVQTKIATVDEHNHRELLAAHLSRGDFLLNLSVDVSSVALLAWCQQAGVLYLDTCIEPWAGAHADPQRTLSERSNHAMREAALALRKPTNGAPTALITHGANPGLVSHFLKQALLDLASEPGRTEPTPATRTGWAALAQRLGVKVIHIAERDTQVGARGWEPGEFVNTWSVRGFIEEGTQPAELGWGSHERRFPADGARHAQGTQAAICLQRPGASTRVRSWTPLQGPMLGFLVTHAEAISIADYLTLCSGATPIYRPTVHYAYRPCNDAVLSLEELAAQGWQAPARQRLLRDDIVGGIDELGVLLMGHARGAYWYGSQLSTSEARTLCSANSATSLQVAAGVLAGVVWALRNPARGINEPDELPFDELLALARPYLGPMVGAFSDWTPLAGRGRLFDEDLALDDPWQFGNFRVA